ncbi:hypothetical protein BDM02DRAFT_3186605 [Thelephora ganbajun]|uniref:Uncharacterized protein n=1 Tax=Thelephora ganbajun TaxID=370292 RepID=A0ACB6ZHE1_THEGA|nr:hypothetical protein BDM02DRAFT_3186605 [Thelephora ganbajun]
MLKRQRPSSPLPIPAAYGDDLSSSILGPSTFHPAANVSASPIQVDPLFGISRKRPRVSPDVAPGVTSVVGSGSAGRHTFFSSSVLSKRRRSPDRMDGGDDSGGDSDSGPHPHISNTYSDYQREAGSWDPLASRPSIDLKRRRTTAPVLEGSSRGWGPDRSETGPDGPGLSSFPHSFDPAHPPVGWTLETQIGEYAQENSKLHDLHALRPRLPYSEEATQDHNANADVDMEEKVVKERYEERNKLLGSLFLERQRRLAEA